MEFVKTHWMLLATGVAALAGIVLGVIGMTRASVLEEMQKRAQAAQEISTLRADAQNQDTINAEKERAQRFAEQYEAVLRTAERINERKPLLEAAFPRPASVEIPYRFREAYVRRLYELPREAKGGTLPNALELQDEAEILADMERRKRIEEGGDAGPEIPTPPIPGVGTPAEAPAGGRGVAPPAGGRGVAPPPAGGRGVAPPAGGRGIAPPAGGRGMMAPPGGGGGAAPPGGASGAGVPGVESDAVRLRASVKKARNIRVYLDPMTSLFVAPLAQRDEPPSSREMWYAQVSLWVQEDLVHAIARVNEEAARELGEKEANVTRLPVKRVESVQVLGYVTSAGTLVPFAAGAGMPEASAAAATSIVSFTGRRGNEQFDVVRVVVTVIVSKRDVLRLVDAMSRTNFYQLVSAEYSDVESVDPAGYFYGPDPVVRAVLDFEGYFARRIYKPLMPAEVLRDLGIETGEEQRP